MLLIVIVARYGTDEGANWCVPLTTKTPVIVGLMVIVPGDCVPSPQLIVDVKSLIVAAGFPSVNVATSPENGWIGVDQVRGDSKS